MIVEEHFAAFGESGKSENTLCVAARHSSRSCYGPIVAHGADEADFAAAGQSDCAAHGSCGADRYAGWSVHFALLTELREGELRKYERRSGNCVHGDGGCGKGGFGNSGCGNGDSQRR